MAQRSSSSKSSSGSASASSSSSNERHVSALRQLLASVPENKECVDCGQRGPTYVNMTAASFVCTKCSGMLRGITPPHRIKSLSMSAFTADEVDWMRQRGNPWSIKVWTGLIDPEERKRRIAAANEARDDEAIKQFIIDKYEKKRYYVDPSTVTFTPAAAVTGTASNSTAGASGHVQLIGSTLTARMQMHQQQHKSEDLSITSNSTAIGRPQNVPVNGSVKPIGVSAPAPVPAVTAPPISNVFATDFGSSDPFAAPVSKPPPSSSSSATASTVSFANFDTAIFDSPPADPLMSQKKSSTTPGIIPISASTSPFQAQSQPQAPRPASSSAIPMASTGTAQDKYAALKDLDDLFKSSVVMQDAVPSSQTTGVSLFGSSPVQPGLLESSNQNATNKVVSPVQGGISSDWAHWKDSPPKNNVPPQASGASVNPFTGATNLTQLNTSPWPTTGNSPVNNGSGITNSGGSAFAQWPQAQAGDKKTDPDPFATSNLQADTSSTKTPTFDAFFENMSAAAGSSKDDLNQNGSNPWQENNIFSQAPSDPFSATNASTVTHNSKNPFL